MRSLLKIYPYKMGSLSAKQIAEALGVKRIIPGGDYRPRSDITILNWGSGSMPFHHDKILNKPGAVAIASNKFRTLMALDQAGVSVVDFTNKKSSVQGWLNLNSKVVVRHTLHGNSGAGVEILRPGAWDIPDAPLYTKYMKKEREFRVHVFKDRVFDFQEKKKKGGVEFEEGADEALIRSHLNGWIFCRTGVDCPGYAKEEAVRAVAALGLDFGAVDVIISRNRAYVLEVNTAPGMENTTLEKYIAEFESYNVRAPRPVRNNRTIRGTRRTGSTRRRQRSGLSTSSVYRW